MLVSRSESMIFPSTYMQVISCLVHYIGIAVVTHCLSRRLMTEDLTSWQGLSQLTWPRTLVLLIFLDSWLFIFSSGVLVFGVGLELSQAMCSVAIYLCIGFYATSKLLIYAFLIEKVHIVWSPMSGLPRFKSRIYILCFTTVALYLLVISFVLFGRIHYFRDGDFVCVVGLKPASSISLLSYDLYINIFLTTLFLWPLFRSNIISAIIRRVAMRTLVASFVALTTSTVNITVLTVLKGHELGWVCLGSCAADVVVNAVALFWVTGGIESTTTETVLDPATAFSDPEYNITTKQLEANTPEPQALEKATLSRQQSPNSRSLRRASLAGSTYEEFKENLQNDIGSSSRSSCKSSSPPNKFKRIMSFFRPSRSIKEHGFQVTLSADDGLEYRPRGVTQGQDDRHIQHGDR